MLSYIIKKYKTIHMCKSFFKWCSFLGGANLKSSPHMVINFDLKNWKLQFGCYK
jgi:hypothetical protein